MKDKKNSNVKRVDCLTKVMPIYWVILGEFMRKVRLEDGSVKFVEKNFLKVVVFLPLFRQHNFPLRGKESAK